MVYHDKVGVDHAERKGPEEFTPVFPESELPENEPHRVEVDGAGVLVVKQHGKIYAIGEKCAHFGGPLAAGQLEDGTIRCPWHGSKFRLADGRWWRAPRPTRSRALKRACAMARWRFASSRRTDPARCRSSFPRASNTRRPRARSRASCCWPARPRGGAIGSTGRPLPRRSGSRCIRSCPSAISITWAGWGSIAATATRAWRPRPLRAFRRRRLA